MGTLLNESHKSCDGLYDCSCPELNELRDSCLEGGSLGTRLTGAGWGGALLSLVPREKLPDFERTIKEQYYSNFSALPLDYYFPTQPAPGIVVVPL